MPFEKGRQKTGGRVASRKTQLKRFEERHPEAYDELMEVLFQSGKDGHSLDAQYVIDRIKGKPTSKIGIDEADKDLVTASLVLEHRRRLDELKRLGEGYIEGEIVEERPVEVANAEDA